MHDVWQPSTQNSLEASLCTKKGGFLQPSLLLDSSAAGQLKRKAKEII